MVSRRHDRQHDPKAVLRNRAAPKNTEPARSNRPTEVREHVRDILLAVGLFCVTLTAYFPALRGTLIWDDDAHVTKPVLRSLHGLWRIWFDLGATQQYYPLLHTAFWLEHAAWGDAVLG